MKIIVFEIIFGIFLTILESWVASESTTTTPVSDKFLPDHPDLKESDKYSVPVAKGRQVQFENITVYESAYKNDTQIMLITIYDIFGFHPHVKFIADKLADQGVFVVIPDLFHGNPVPLENFPQPRLNNFY